MAKKKTVVKRVTNDESMDSRLKFRFTEKQLEVIDGIKKTSAKAVFINGPAGTSKSFLAVYCGIKEIYSPHKDSMLYIRTAAESGRINIGARPGEVGEKIHHLVTPLRDKLEELLSPQEVLKLLSEENGKIEAMPVNDVRGSGWRNKFVIVDEAQNFEYSELVTVITRLGENSKIIFIGGSSQSDIRKSGWPHFLNAFSDEESKSNGILHYAFGSSDIVRSKFVRFVVEHLEKYGEPE